MSQRKAITFLGTGNYEAVPYTCQDQRCVTRYFAVALAQFYRPDIMLVVMTKEARAKHWDTLAPLLAGIPVEAVDIPTGKSEDDLWQIFDTIAGRITPGDQLIFDITHSFRSQPLLALLITSYVRVVKAVQVEALIYGAFEARTDDSGAPVFDLTPFVRLLDWTAATDMFLKTGLAADLVELVQGEADRAIPVLASPAAPRKAPASPNQLLKSRLTEVAQGLGDLADALRLTRPIQVMEAAHRLLQRIDQLRRQIEQAERPFATQPFVLLLEKIVAQFTPLALGDPLRSEQGQENLARQRAQLRWYLDHQQFVQAITLARELLISARLLAVDPSANQRDLARRREIEDRLNSEAHMLRGPGPRHGDPALLEAARQWDALSSLRNDVNHAGMRPDARKTHSIIEGIREQCAKLL